MTEIVNVEFTAEDKAVDLFVEVMGGKPGKALGEALLLEALAMLGAVEGRPALAKRLREIAEGLELTNAFGARN